MTRPATCVVLPNDWAAKKILAKTICVRKVWLRHDGAFERL
jgi:hypothetical protein